MKATELMIGDLVMYNPNVFIDDEYKPTKECYMQRISSGEDIDLAIEGCYYPIPLTAEILEKNGWVNKEEKGWMQKGNFGESPLMLWYIKDTGIFNPHFAYELEVSDLSKDGGLRIKVQCVYIHTLQHALRLCGLNDLADNFKI